MTTPTFVEDLQAGGGSYAAVFYISTMGWACTTHDAFARQLNGEGSMGLTDRTAVRRSLFGAVSAAPNHPALNVQLLPSLDANLGGQANSYDESKGFTGGSWKVSIGREAGGANYAEIRQGAVDGIYDGLDLIPDPNFSSSIATGRLSSSFINPASTLKWIQDEGLAAYVTAQVAAAGFALIWSAPYCFMTTDATPTLSGGEYTITGTSMGALRSPKGSLYPASDDSPSMRLASAPVDGVVGLNAVLWFMRVDPNTGIPLECDAGTGDLDDYQKPINFRCGPVKPGPKGNPGEWVIECHHWVKWWDTNIKFDRAKGKLSGYRFTRQPTTFDAPNGDTVYDTSSATYTLRCQTPHLYLCEWDTGTGQYERTNIWLCNAASSVTFETLQDLVDAVQDELTNHTHSDTPYKNYAASIDELTVVDPTVDYPTFVSGAVPWILGYGRPNSIPNQAWSVDYNWAPDWEIATYTTMKKNAIIQFGSSAYRQLQDDLNPTPVASNILMEVLDGLVGAKMKYYYEYNFTTADFCNNGWKDGKFSTGAEPSLQNAASPPQRFLWPIPQDTINADYRLNLSPEVDATSFTDDEPFVIGPLKWQLHSDIESTGANYLKTPTTSAYLYDSIPCLFIENDVYNYSKWPMCLFELDDSAITMPFQKAQDVEQSTMANDGTVSEVFRGLLGDSSDGVSMPSRSRLWYVPDVYDDSIDMRELVDWDRLANITDGLYPSSTLRLPTTGDYNIWKSFMSTLLSHGVRPTWGYNESKRAWVMSFETAGIVSGATAFLEGRVLDDSLIGRDEPTVTHGGAWLYKDLKAETNYIGEDAQLTIQIESVNSNAARVGGSKTLKIEDKFLQLDETDEFTFATVMESLNARLQIVPTTLTADITPTGLVVPTVGSSALVSASNLWNIYGGSRGVSQLGALVTSANISYISGTSRLSDGKFSIKTKLRMSPYVTQGWAPSLPLTGAMQSLASTTVTLTGLPVTAATSKYVNPTGGLTGLAMFGCFTWSPSNGLNARVCSCTAFPVRIIDRNVRTYVTTGASRNVWTGTIVGAAASTLQLTDVNAGTARVLLDDATNYDDSTPKMVRFRERDFAGIQDCQTVFGVLGDASGFATDSAGNEQRAFSLV